MQKLTNFAGGVRHGWDMQFGMNRHQQNQPHQHQHQHPHQQHHGHPNQHHGPHDMPRTPNYSRQQNPSITHLPPTVPMSWCFKIPFNNTLAGPEVSQLIFASNGAKERWTHPEDAPEDSPTHRLPIHVQHVEDLQARCAVMKEQSNVEASVTIGRAASLTPISGLQPAPSNNVVTNVCLHGPNFEIVKRVREHILNTSPINLVSGADVCVTTR